MKGRERLIELTKLILGKLQRFKATGAVMQIAQREKWEI
jgi:hypothetical protein